MSNQTAGADRQSCAWCSVRIAVHFAASIDPPNDGRWDVRFYLLAWKSAARALLKVLATEAAVIAHECRGCSDSAAMSRGEDLHSDSQEQIAVMARFVRIRRKVGE